MMMSASRRGGNNGHGRTRSRSHSRSCFWPLKVFLGWALFFIWLPSLSRAQPTVGSDGSTTCPVGDDLNIRTFGTQGQVAASSSSGSSFNDKTDASSGSSNITTTTTTVGTTLPYYRGLPPLELVPGCEYELDLQDKVEAYVRVIRKDTSTRLRVSWELEGDQDPPWFLFSWHGQCCGGHNPHASLTKSTIYGDWGFKPQAWTGEVVYLQQENGQDNYHCTPACRTYMVTPWTGELLITVSTWFSYGRVAGKVTFSLEEERPYIKPDQLSAIKDVYDECCASRQAPMGWSSDAYKTANGTDTDQVPYCTWLKPPFGSASVSGASNTWDAMKFNEQSCDDIPGAFCDKEGNVVELTLFEKGLKCPFPQSIGKLQSLEILDLGRNRIEGSVPAAVAELRNLRKVSMLHNRVEGDVPCFASNKLTEITMSNNRLGGTLPSCYNGDQLKTRHPAIRTLRIDRNVIGGMISTAAFATSSQYPEQLVALDLSLNKFEGKLLDNLCNLLSSLRTLRLSRNRLSGGIPACLLENMPQLVDLDLSYNKFSGVFPKIGKPTKNLKRLQVQHNDLVGSVSTQLNAYVENVRETVHSSDAILNLGANRFSGELPESLRYLLYSAATPLSGMVLGGNHFRCDMTTGSWPLWAMRAPLMVTSDALGNCAPVPQPASVQPATAPGGSLIELGGSGFVQSDELACFFHAVNRDSRGTRNGLSPELFASTTAVYLNSTLVSCMVPFELTNNLANADSSSSMTGDATRYGKKYMSMNVYRGDDIFVSVANYGDDIASKKTLGDSFVMPSFKVECRLGYAGNVCQYSAENTCSSRGTPTDEGKCTCFDGFEGPTCQDVAKNVIDQEVSKHVQTMDVSLIVGLTVSILMFVGCCSFALVMIRRERKGEPLFTPLPTSEEEAYDMETEMAGRMGRAPHPDSFTPSPIEQRALASEDTNVPQTLHAAEP
ncbi:EGF-like domain-containing protein [Pseudoscourfieldia marina]